METPVTPLLDETESAKYLMVAVATLRRWRWSGKGPRFVKIGSRVRYVRKDLDDFIDAGLRASTSDPGPDTRVAAA